jgi:hypothetical protein
MQFIAHLKKELSSESNLILTSSFKKAERLSTTNDEEAYLLRIILNDEYLGQNGDQIRKKVKAAAAKHPSGKYYLLEYRPEFDDWHELALCSACFGILALIVGIWMVLDNTYMVEFSLTYLVEIVKGGGYAIILGVVLLIGGLAKYVQEIKRKKLIRQHEVRNGG